LGRLDSTSGVLPSASEQCRVGQHNELNMTHFLRSFWDGLALMPLVRWIRKRK